MKVHRYRESIPMKKGWVFNVRRRKQWVIFCPFFETNDIITPHCCRNVIRLSHLSQHPNNISNHEKSSPDRQCSSLSDIRPSKIVFPPFCEGDRASVIKTLFSLINIRTQILYTDTDKLRKTKSLFLYALIKLTGHLLLCLSRKSLGYCMAFVWYEDPFRNIFYFRIIQHHNSGDNAEIFI